MAEIVLFTLVGIALYFAADWLLQWLERARGRPFAHRQAIYFVIILVLALGLFRLINYVRTGA